MNISSTTTPFHGFLVILKAALRAEAAIHSLVVYPVVIAKTTAAKQQHTL